MNFESINNNLSSLIEELKFIDSQNISALKEKTLALYEQLVLLEYSEPKEVIEEKEIEQAPVSFSIPKEEIVDEANLKSIEDEKPTIDEILIDDTVVSETPVFESIDAIEETRDEEEENGPDLLHELENITEGFELPEFEPASPTINSIQEHPKSLNEILNKSVQIGLNDRIAFINHLFERNQEDYTRVISQVNTMQNVDEVESFIETFVKPEYNNWDGKEPIVERFLQVVLKRFEA